MKTVIIKYNAGNVQSVLFALERIGVKGILSDNFIEFSDGIFCKIFFAETNILLLALETAETSL